VISSGEGMQVLVEGFQRSFGTDSGDEEHRHKVDHFVARDSAAGKAHLFADGLENALLVKIVDEEHDLSQPGGRRGDRLRRGLDDHSRIGDTIHKLPPL
jgi:hypothetical protein